MTPYGKTAQNAIAAVSRLAEVYDPVERVKLNSADITENRHLRRPVVARPLTILSQAGELASTSNSSNCAAPPRRRGSR